MKVVIQRWGLIRHFEYDLSKSMVITYGENNIGKSYAMQIMYLLLKNLLSYAKFNAVYPQGFYFSPHDDRFEEVKKVVMDFVVGDEKEIDITNKMKTIFSNRMADEMIQSFVDSCKNTFGTYEELLKQNPVISIVFGNSNFYKFLLAEQSVEISLDIKPVFLKKTTSEFHKSRDNKTHFDIYVCDNKIQDPILKVEEVLGDMKKKLVTDIISAIENVYFLPASRSGIYNGMNSFGPILAELAKNRAYIRSQLVIPTLSEPISDYFMALSNIHSDLQGAYYRYAEKIEHAVLRGEVSFNNKKKSMVYKPYDEQLELEMTDTSSMISEISPITAFLKYIVRTSGKIHYGKNLEKKAGEAKSIIFIEEPEAHLHPANQIALIEILVQLSQNKVTMVMSSHSNYIFNKLNNMIMSKQMEKDSYLPILLRKEEGKSSSEVMECDEFGVSDDNFSDTANELFEEREEILERMMSLESEE